MDRRTAIEWLERIKHNIHGGDEEFDRQRKESLDMAITDMKICEANSAGWISTNDRLPPERDTIFAKLKGTDKWKSGMFEKMSDDVRVAVLFDDGTRKVSHDYTVDGKWHGEMEKCAYPKRTVTHWMANPEPPKEET